MNADDKRAYLKVGPRRYREDQGMYFDEFAVGDTFEHRPGRTLTEVDNIWQSLLNMNQSPLHVDASYCARTEYGKPVISSLVTFSVVNGMSVRSMSAKGIVNLGWDKVRLLEPCFPGDTVYAESTVTAARLSASRVHHGIVTCETRGVKADGCVFLSCERSFLVPTREHQGHRDARY